MGGLTDGVCGDHGACGRGRGERIPGPCVRASAWRGWRGDQVTTAPTDRAIRLQSSANGVPIGKGVTAQTVGKWRSRFERDGIPGLSDAPRSGRPRTISDGKVAEVIDRTLRAKPAKATRWSTTLMAEETDLNAMAVSRIWRAFGLKPHRLGTFKLSTDPHFVEKGA